MKGMGPRIERETIINFNEAEETVSVWTASDMVYRKLLKLCWKIVESGERHAIFEAPKQQVRLTKPRVPRALSPKQLQTLQELHEKQRKKPSLYSPSHQEEIYSPTLQGRGSKRVK